MLLDVDDSQLLLVDYQARLMPFIHDAPGVILNATRLGRIAQAMQVPVFGTEQNPAGLGENVPEVRALCSRTLPKVHFSACADGLVDWLRPRVQPRTGSARSVPRHLRQDDAPAGRNSIVIAGCETHVCMLQTSLDLLEHEFEVWVVTDACGSRTERNRDAAFDRLAGAGAELVTTEMVAFEWLRSSDHPLFKQVLDIAK